MTGHLLVTFVCVCMYVMSLCLSVYLSVCLCDADEDSGGSEEEGGNKVTMAYRSLEKKEREGPQDMGATATIEIDTEVKVRKSTWTKIQHSPDQQCLQVFFSLFFLSLVFEMSFFFFWGGGGGRELRD